MAARVLACLQGISAANIFGSAAQQIRKTLDKDRLEALKSIGFASETKDESLERDDFLSNRHPALSF